MAKYFLQNAIKWLQNMKTAKFYADYWLINKPPNLPNYLIYNLNCKKEICYIFRLHVGATAELATLYERGK